MNSEAFLTPKRARCTPVITPLPLSQEPDANSDFLVSALFQCVPIEAIWNPSIKGQCVKVQLAATIFGVFNVATDFALLILPLPLLWKLQMANRLKLQTIGIFCLGGLYVSLALRLRLLIRR